MAIFKYPDFQKFSEAAGKYVVKRLEESESSFMGLSTGYSPRGIYLHVAKQLVKKTELIQRIQGFQIDEWYGLSVKDPSSCAFYINQHVVKPWKLHSNQRFLVDGQHPDQEIQISEMKMVLNQRRLDICILGLGKNGHLALNEPGSQLTSACRIVELDSTSQTHPMLKNAKATVQKGITIGLKEILESKEIILLIAGKGKKEAFQKLMNKTSIESFPASAIYYHDNWKCFIDESSLT